MLKLTGAAVAGSTLFGLDAIAAESPATGTSGTTSQGGKKRKPLLLELIPTILKQELAAQW